MRLDFLSKISYNYYRNNYYRKEKKCMMNLTKYEIEKVKYFIEEGRLIQAMTQAGLSWDGMAFILRSLYSTLKKEGEL